MRAKSNYSIYKIIDLIPVLLVKKMMYKPSCRLEVTTLIIWVLCYECVYNCLTIMPFICKSLIVLLWDKILYFSGAPKICSIWTKSFWKCSHCTIIDLVSIISMLVKPNTRHMYLNITICLDAVLKAVFLYKIGLNNFLSETVVSGIPDKTIDKSGAVSGKKQTTL